MRFIISGVILFSVFLCKEANAQVNPEDMGPEYIVANFGINAGINVATCGISALINDREPLADMAKCLGASTIQYAGIGIMAADAPFISGFAGRATLQLGTSIIDNTVSGKDAMDTYYYDVGPLLFSIDSEGVDVEWRIFPIVGMVSMLARGGQLNILETLNYQTPIFNLDLDNGVGGITNANVIGIDPDALHFNRAILTHELIHMSQYIRLQPLDNLAPEFLGAAKLRIGEDIGMLSLSAPETICRLIDENSTDCKWGWPGFPIEFEAYSFHKTVADINQKGN